MIAKPKPEHGVLYAHGGEPISSRSIFMKQADAFRNDSEKTNFKKVGKGGDLSKMSGDSKSRKPIKPARGKRP